MEGEHPSDVHFIKTDLPVPLVNIYSVAGGEQVIN